MIRTITASLAALVLSLSTPVISAAPPDNWDGLIKVHAKKLEVAYLQPGADFRGYTKIMLDPTEVSFRKNWQRDHNDMVNRIDDRDVRRILDDAQRGFQKLFQEAYTKGGYQIVTEPGPDVLRLSTGVINLDVVAPDTMSAGRSWTFSRETGEATLVVEARDSLSGALLGRALDRRILDDARLSVRNSVTNSSDFELVFKRWAQISADALTELKELSPVDAAGLQRR